MCKEMPDYIINSRNKNVAVSFEYKVKKEKLITRIVLPINPSV